MSSKTPILDRINQTSNLHSLSNRELHDLVSELRYELISSVSQTGGHFASSLGVVELTVAIHAIFNTPEDRVIWDVGHQAYVHKMLTGRREQMSSVRQLGGISGFPRRNESHYDAFGVGHAGTSISAATGMLEASSRVYPGHKARRVVAIIGDGAMTAGMAFEALNHSGQLNRKLIVILNDNEMSIAPNVGALSLAFSKTLTSKFSTTARRHFKSLVDKGLIPQIFYTALDRAEEAAQGFFSAPSMLFESFGYRYLGPIDGNNLEAALDALKRAIEQDGPVLIHALTVKGKGYEPAENDPVKFHGVGPFDVNGGTIKNSPTKVPPTYTEIFGQALVEIAQADSRVVGVTAAMPDGTGLDLLAKTIPDRFFDVGIAEQHAVTFCAGLACEGMKPICAIYSSFLQRAYDQLIHDVCLQSLPVVFAIDRGGLVGADGATHHGAFDLSFLRCIPNLVLMAPKDEVELRDMLYTAYRRQDGPTALRYPRGYALDLDLSRPMQEIPIGRAELLHSEGAVSGGTLLIGIGQTVYPCIRAAETLHSQYGIKCSVINARFIKPLDQDLLCNFIDRHSLIVTVEDNAIQGGFGSAVVELMSDTGLSKKRNVVRLGIEDSFIEHGTQAELYKLCGYDTAGIINCVKTMLSNELSATENRTTTERRIAISAP
ncbi:MAG: 1-deoxy-D-xylulose-5-phosphate synthase [Deltaproteobacteria bacterium]|nr:1-deoxy-D-xylulose-5-phosphate synthase [Deltaproteobacteria bacterium]